MNNPVLSAPAALALTKNLTSKRPLVLFLLGLCSALIWPTFCAAATTSVFGPKRYTRSAGRPQTFTEAFQHCGTAPCQIIVVNGNANGTKRISCSDDDDDDRDGDRDGDRDRRNRNRDDDDDDGDRCGASISLNGRRIIRPGDFGRGVARIIRPVVLSAQNKLVIRLASKPRSFLTVSVRCDSSPAILSAGQPGVSLFDPTTLLAAFSINNSGAAAAENVQVTAITLPGGAVTVPTLPDNLGTIPAHGSVTLNADFTGAAFTPGGTYPLTIEGTYGVHGCTSHFTLDLVLVVPPAAPGSAPLTFVTIESHPPFDGPPFPPVPPSFDDDVNPGGPPVPTAPFVPGTQTPTNTTVQMAPPTSEFLAPAPPGPIVFPANSALGLTPGTRNGTAGNPAEPSGASGGGVIFVTANQTAAYSTDGGTTFTQLDPSTIFPNDAVGFCCDQIVQYVPSIDRFIWLLQGANFNGYRLASASPADIIRFGGDQRAWAYWNLTPQVFGQPNGTGFDYPDLSVGNNSLNMSWDAGVVCPSGCRNGFQVVEASLAEIQAGGSINLGFTDPKDGSLAWGSHLTQNPGDEAFWAGHNGNTKLRVFSSIENSGTYSWRDVGISSWANDAPSSLTPDGQDWLAKNFNDPNSNTFPRNAVIGSTRLGKQLWFAWSAGKRVIGAKSDSFPQAHVEMVTLDRSKNFEKIQQVQIWNNNYAFAYPALATNAFCLEVGLSFEFGGGGNYENHVVGFWGDFLAYITTMSNVGTTRFGDYVTIRQAPVTEANPGNLFTAFGYGLNSVPPPGTGITIDIRYVLFGRPKEYCLIP